MAYTFEHNTGTAINEGDPWRPTNAFVHGPGQIGQIVKCSIYDGGWVEDIYYHYDALGNVMGYTDSNANATTYEMDAFGNRITNSSYWESMTSFGQAGPAAMFLDIGSGLRSAVGSNVSPSDDESGEKEHLTGKMLDDDTGLYYFHARWYDPQVGGFISASPLFPRESRYLFCENDPVNYQDPSGFLRQVGTADTTCDACQAAKQCKAIEQRAWQVYNLRVSLKNMKWKRGGTSVANLECQRDLNLWPPSVPIVPILHWNSPWSPARSCLNKCAYDHELVHVQQCFSLGPSKYKALALLPYQHEPAAYAVEHACLMTCIRSAKQRSDNTCAGNVPPAELP